MLSPTSGLCPTSNDITTWSDTFIDNVLFSPSSPLYTTNNSTFTLSDFGCNNLFSSTSSTVPLTMTKFFGTNDPNKISSIRTMPDTVVDARVVVPIADPNNTNCPAGAFYDRSTGKCDNCPAGTYSSSSNTLKCGRCSAGTYSLAAATECIACGAGAFQNLSGQSSCKPALAGTYSANFNARIPSICPAGSYSPGSTEKCITCAVANANGANYCDTTASYAQSRIPSYGSPLGGGCPITACTTAAPCSTNKLAQQWKCTNKTISGLAADMFATGSFSTATGDPTNYSAKYLRKVDLSNNQLTYIHPATFSSLPNLRLLNLSNNPLKYNLVSNAFQNDVLVIT